MITKIFSNGGKGSPFVAALVVPLSHTSVIHETLVRKVVSFHHFRNKGRGSKNVSSLGCEAVCLAK